jgi:hypothetical protein
VVAQPLLQRQWRRAGAMAAVVAAGLLVLQVPYFISRIQQPEAAAGPSAALNAMARPDAFAPSNSYRAVVNIAGGLLARPLEFDFALPVMVVSLVVMIAWRKDLAVLAVTAGPIAAATLLFSTWTRAYDSYWFLTATTAIALTAGMAVAALPSAKAVQGISLALLGGVLLWQPARVSAAPAFFSYPQYRAMRLGSIELARQADVLRDIRITFDAHPTMDKYFIFKILGGRIDPAAPRTGFIEADGRVRIE